MIVFDLVCGNASHVFEAWFGSSKDYEDQKARGLLACPICGDANVEKAVMAPNVAPKGNQRSEAPSRVPTQSDAAAMPVANDSPPAPAELMRALAFIQEKMLKDSVWVGKDFTEKARAMHFDEIERQSIHGEATVDQVREMLEEGIDLQPLPLPVVPPKARN